MTEGLEHLAESRHASGAMILDKLLVFEGGVCALVNVPCCMWLNNTKFYRVSGICTNGAIMSHY